MLQRRLALADDLGAGADTNETWRRRLGTATFVDDISIGDPQTAENAVITKTFHAIQLTPTTIIYNGIPRNITMVNFVNFIQELVVADGLGTTLGVDGHFGTLVQHLSYNGVAWNGRAGTGGVPCR